VNEILAVSDTLNDTLKEMLVERFRAHLDGFNNEAVGDLSGLEDTGQEDSATDLRSLYVELAALRTEVRAESRLVKDTLDLVRGTVERAETAREAAEREAERIRSEALQREKALLRPLLIDLLEVRDRLSAGVSGPASTPVPTPWYRRVFRRSDNTGAEAWREGLRMTLNRFDRVLGDRGVVPLDLVGRPFDPKTARAVGTVTDPQRDTGIVTQEVRAGFLWEGELLRAADVVVNKSS
jgi:molecular chaperone GrpE